MDYILHLETATKTCSVALSNNGKLIAVKEETAANYSHAEQLTLFIQDVLSEAKVTFQDLVAVSVTSGPGSYTGLRIGVSTGKGICFAQGIPLIAVNSLESLAAVAKEKYKNATLCPMLDARRMEVFNAIYSENGKALKGITADVIDEASYQTYEPFVFFGDGAEKVKELWRNREVEFAPEIFNSAKGHVALAFEKYQNRQEENLAYFEPFYLKDFVAGKKKKTTGKM